MLISRGWNLCFLQKINECCCPLFHFKKILQLLSDVSPQRFGKSEQFLSDAATRRAHRFAVVLACSLRRGEPCVCSRRRVRRPRRGGANGILHTSPVAVAAAAVPFATSPVGFGVPPTSGRPHRNPPRNSSSSHFAPIWQKIEELDEFEVLWPETCRAPRARASGPPPSSPVTRAADAGAAAQGACRAALQACGRSQPQGRACFVSLERVTTATATAILSTDYRSAALSLLLSVRRRTGRCGCRPARRARACATCAASASPCCG